MHRLRPEKRGGTPQRLRPSRRPACAKPRLRFGEGRGTVLHGRQEDGFGMAEMEEAGCCLDELR